MAMTNSLRDGRHYDALKRKMTLRSTRHTPGRLLVLSWK